MDHQMKDMFCKQIDAELDRLSKMQSLTDVSLNQLQKLTDTKKNLLKIEILENQLYGNQIDGNSFRGTGSYGYNMGNSNRYPMQYYPGSSYDMGYSRTDAYSHLEAAMKDARNEQEREEIRQIMSRYHN